MMGGGGGRGGRSKGWGGLKKGLLQSGKFRTNKTPAHASLKEIPANVYKHFERDGRLPWVVGRGQGEGRGGGGGEITWRNSLQASVIFFFFYMKKSEK